MILVTNLPLVSMTPESLQLLVSRFCGWLSCCIKYHAVFDGASAVAGILLLLTSFLFLLLTSLIWLASLLFLSLNAVVSVLMLLWSCSCWHMFWSWCYNVVGISSVVASYCYWLFCCCWGPANVNIPSACTVTPDVIVPSDVHIPSVAGVPSFLAFMLLCGILLLTPVANFPLVSTTMKTYRKNVTAGVIDSSGKSFSLTICLEFTIWFSYK